MSILSDAVLKTISELFFQKPSYFFREFTKVYENACKFLCCTTYYEIKFEY
jgi:Mlc titration factor MtfA (ptsG expression regulator)